MSLTKVKQNIQDARKKQGISVTEFMRRMSNATNISVGTIYRIINEPHRAKYDSLKKVVEYAGLSLDDVREEIFQEQAME